MSVRDLINRIENKDSNYNHNKGLGKSKFKNMLDFWDSGGKKDTTSDSDDNSDNNSIIIKENSNFTENLNNWQKLSDITGNTECNNDRQEEKHKSKDKEKKDRNKKDKKKEKKIKLKPF